MNEQKPEEEKTDYAKETHDLVTRLFNELNEAHLLRYIELVQSPKKIFWLNFLSGIAKGLGLTIGTAIVLMLLFKITQHIIALNIPYITVWITDWIAEITELLKSTR